MGQEGGSTPNVMGFYMGVQRSSGERNPRGAEQGKQAINHGCSQSNSLEKFEKQESFCLE